MEYRLFFIGLSMGAFAWISRGWQKTGGPETPARSGAWHGLFLFLAGFSITMILAMSFDSRSRFITVAAHALSVGELYPALAAGLVLGALGFARGFSKGGKAESRRHFLNEDLEWADTVFSAALMASILMMFVIQAFKIPSGSMENTLLVGDHLFVNKFIYGLRIPFSGKRLLPLRPVDRGDIMVFQFPVEDVRETHCGSVQYGKDFIKRVIGLPGETVEVREGRVFVDGKLLAEEPYAQYTDPYRQPPPVHSRELSREAYQRAWVAHELDKELGDLQRDYFGPVQVPPKSYFMMGDNRDHSCDSRYWGPVEERFVKGKAWFLYWPPSRIKAAR